MGKYPFIGSLALAAGMVTLVLAIQTYNQGGGEQIDSPLSLILLATGGLFTASAIAHKMTENYVTRELRLPIDCFGSVVPQLTTGLALLTIGGLMHKDMHYLHHCRISATYDVAYALAAIVLFKVGHNLTNGTIVMLPDGIAKLIKV